MGLEPIIFGYLFELSDFTDKRETVFDTFKTYNITTVLIIQNCTYLYSSKI